MPKKRGGRTVVITISVTETDLRDADAAVQRGTYKNRSELYRDGLARLRQIRAI